MEKSDSRPVHLVELVNTTCEQLVDDLIASVKHVVIGDWFQGQIFNFKGGGGGVNK